MEEQEEYKPAVDKMLGLAQRIKLGEAGVDFIYCLEEDKFYSYLDGYWKQVFDVEMLGDISKSIPYVNKFPLHMRKQIIDNLKTITYKPLSEFNKNNYLNFPEGLFDVSKQELLPHDKENVSTIRMPYSYDQEAFCFLWKKTLGEIFDGDQKKIDVLQEFFGYCLTRDTKHEKALLLLGESRTGKSTILHVLRSLIGDKNCSSVALKFISNPQYTPLLINKMVNIDSDVCGKAQDFEAEFKTITSGEPVSVNQKFVATFEFKPYCKLVMAANEFPRITDHSSAFYKRLILIPCDRVFEESEQNRNLKTLLLKELPGILNWAIEGYVRLYYARGKFEQNEFMKDAVAELREESNPIEVFFKEHVKPDVSVAGIEIDKGELYQHYVHWCRTNGNAPMSSVKFSQAVFRKYSKYTPKNTMNNNTKKRVWKNLVYFGSRHVPEQVTNWQE